MTLQSWQSEIQYYEEEKRKRR